MKGASPRYAVTSPRAKYWPGPGNIQAPEVSRKLAGWPQWVENTQDGTRP